MTAPQPNRRLRAARERAGLSRTVLAEAVALWLAERDPRGRDVAFDANHLGKLERGTIERPRENYIAALCAVLQLSETDLGFDHSSRANTDDVNRKAFLQVALGVSAGTLASRFADHDATDLISAVAGPTAHYGRLGDAISTAELSPAVEAHLRLAHGVVHDVLPTRDGFAVLSEAAVLAGWVARERDDVGTARRHYRAAVSHAERAEHPLLTAFMLQSRGNFVAEAGEHEQGVRLLERARRTLEEARAPGCAVAHVAAWLALTHAEVGDRRAVLAELRRAEALTGQGGTRWPWVLVLSPAKAERYRASVFAKLGDLTAARHAFAGAASALTAPRPRAQAQVDHARGLARAGQVDEACALAMEALTVGQRFGFERIVRQIRSLRGELPDTGEAAELEDGLARHST